jgi:chromosome segregation ATPase
MTTSISIIDQLRIAEATRDQLQADLAGANAEASTLKARAEKAEAERDTLKVQLRNTIEDRDGLFQARAVLSVELAARNSRIETLGNELMSALNREGEALEQLSEARKALVDMLPPAYGVHGGPLTCMIAIYEDGTNENSARHRGVISRELVEAARKAQDGGVS